jgi:hypothetical protein
VSPEDLSDVRQQSGKIAGVRLNRASGGLTFQVDGKSEVGALRIHT